MRNISLALTIIIILLSAVFMLINPQETVQAASQGLLLWYSVVLPALLPFFIVAELLVKIRLVNFLGILLEPIMRPLFRLPGCSSLVVVMGFTSGFPVGAILTRRLYDQEMLTDDEAERLLAFTNNASPLFILGAVGVGMFASPAAGYLLAIAHYLSNFLVGIIWRFRGNNSPGPSMPGNARLRTAYQAMLPVPGEIPEGTGKILGDAIRNSLNNTMAVGGFIIVFSVLTRMLTIWGFIDCLTTMLLKILGMAGLSYGQIYGLCMGFFEMTIGAKTVIGSDTGNALPLLMVVSSILAFSGLSIIAQIMSIMAGTNIRLSFYLLSRLLQVIISCIITLIAYRITLVWGLASVRVNSIPFYKVLYDFNAWTFSINCLAVAGLIILALTCAALCRSR